MRPTTMPRRHAVTARRLLGVAQLALGFVLSAHPEQVARSAAGSHGRPAPSWLVRGLGLRSLLQGAVVTAAPTTSVVAGGAAVDATHALTMAPFIALCARYRRAAAISALVASASAVAGAAAAARTSEAHST